MKHLITIAAALLAATPAVAHPGHGAGFAGGFAHPLTGLDHVLAMLAVGLWAALSGKRAMLAWPTAFVAAMAAGFGLTQMGVVAPQVEPMILGSVIALGSAIALRLDAPVWLGAAAIAAFGIAHGAAHGMELHGTALTFAGGFMLASLLLHAAGIGLAALFSRITARWPARLTGAGMVAAGIALAFSAT
jgi:urease accessory protein